MKANNEVITFYKFFCKFVSLNRIQLKIRPFHKEVCDTLQGVFTGKINKKIVIINISPRVGKTKLMEAFVCWCYSYFPDCHFIYASYSSDLATASTRYVLDTLQKEWYTATFGEKLGDVRKADYFHTKAGGVMKGDGTGGTLTGFGAGLKRVCGGALICDDLQKPAEALSKAVTAEVQTWLTRTMISRLNGPQTPVIICAQRISEEDACGYVLKNYPDDVIHLKYPAMIDGESTIEDTKSTIDLKTLERVDPFTFYSQYQQEPIILGGNLIKTDWFRLFDGEIDYEYKFFTADTAMKVKEHNDFSVISCWGVSNGKIYLDDMVRGKFEAHVLEKVAIEFYNKHSPRFVLIEDKASGVGLIQTLRNLGFPIIDVQRTTDKLTRVMETIPFLAVGVVHIRKDAEYTSQFLSECAGFRSDMGHKHDDQVDTLCDAVNHVCRKKVSIFDAL